MKPHPAKRNRARKPSHQLSALNPDNYRLHWDQVRRNGDANLPISKPGEAPKSLPFPIDTRRRCLIACRASPPYEARAAHNKARRPAGINRFRRQLSAAFCRAWPALETTAEFGPTPPLPAFRVRNSPASGSNPSGSNKPRGALKTHRASRRSAASRATARSSVSKSQPGVPAGCGTAGAFAGALAPATANPVAFFGTAPLVAPFALASASALAFAWILSFSP